MASCPKQLQNPTILVDALYCAEDNIWDEDLRGEQPQDCCFHNISNKITRCNKTPFPVLLEHDLFWEDEQLSCLLSKEEHNQLCKNLETNPSLARAREEAVEWMLKVNAHYSFTCLTAFLAVNYLDRFLFNFQFQQEKPWMTQLAAVACLSLAAKVEETQVPLLLDLQVEDSKFLFEAKTIQRMEILVLSTLQWRMNPVTPLSFIDFFTRRLGFKEYFICSEFLKRCEFLLLSVISDARLMDYLPSVIATATMLHVIKSVEPCLGLEYQDQLPGILRMDKEKVERCSEMLMQSITKGVLHDRNFSHKRKFSSVPGSPNGVMEMSFSSDNSNESWAVGSLSSSSPSSPEPLSKKLRAQDQLLQRLHHHAISTPDFLTIPR